MKTQMRFQKIICLVMILAGALALVYAFAYATGSLAELSKTLNSDRTSSWQAAEGKYDATFYFTIQGFNDALMYCGVAMILLAVVLYITHTQKRRNYYISNYVATGACALGNIVTSVVLMAMNAFWKSEFLNLDFAAWDKSMEYYKELVEEGLMSPDVIHYSESTLWFDLGFAVYSVVIVASLLLIFNLVWKIMLMKGEKKLLNGVNLVGGEAV